MDIDNDNIFTVVEEEVKKMGFFKRIASIFVSPVLLMRNIKSYPVIAPMLLLGMGLNLLLMPFWSKLTEISTGKMMEVMVERYGQEYMELMEGTQAALANPTTTIIATVSASVSSVISFLVACLFQALILLIITKIIRGSANYAQYVSLYAHVLIITAIGSLITTPVMATVGTLLDVSSLAAIFMPSGDFSMIPYNILSAITLFEILKSVLLVIGVREINKFSTSESVAAVSIMFILSVAFTAALSSSSLFFMDMAFRSIL
ncbi:MAG: hypothetical protein FWH55_13565 [Oscillospiraceae bacterium]|nr:hypothetical protein [Oscillospiraceae bacterium]